MRRAPFEFNRPRTVRVRVRGCVDVREARTHYSVIRFESDIRLRLRRHCRGRRYQDAYMEN